MNYNPFSINQNNSYYNYQQQNYQSEEHYQNEMKIPYENNYQPIQSFPTENQYEERIEENYQNNQNVIQIQQQTPKRRRKQHQSHSTTQINEDNNSFKQINRTVSPVPSMKINDDIPMENYTGVSSEMNKSSDEKTFMKILEQLGPIQSQYSLWMKFRKFQSDIHHVEERFENIDMKPLYENEIYNQCLRENDLCQKIVDYTNKLSRLKQLNEELEKKEKEQKELKENEKDQQIEEKEENQMEIEPIEMNPYNEDKQRLKSFDRLEQSINSNSFGLNPFTAFNRIKLGNPMNKSNIIDTLKSFSFENQTEQEKEQPKEFKEIVDESAMKEMRIIKEKIEEKIIRKYQRPTTKDDELMKQYEEIKRKKANIILLKQTDDEDTNDTNEDDITLYEIKEYTQMPLYIGRSNAEFRRKGTFVNLSEYAHTNKISHLQMIITFDCEKKLYVMNNIGNHKISVNEVEYQHGEKGIVLKDSTEIEIDGLKLKIFYQ